MKGFSLQDLNIVVYRGGIAGNRGFGRMISDRKSLMLSKIRFLEYKNALFRTQILSNTAAW